MRLSIGSCLAAMVMAAGSLAGGCSTTVSKVIPAIPAGTPVGDMPVDNGTAMSYAINTDDTGAFHGLAGPLQFNRQPSMLTALQGTQMIANITQWGVGPAITFRQIDGTWSNYNHVSGGTNDTWYGTLDNYHWYPDGGPNGRNSNGGVPINP